MTESAGYGKMKLEHLRSMVPWDIVKSCLALQHENYSSILKEAVLQLKHKTYCKKLPRRHAIYAIHTFCKMWNKDINLFAFFCLIFLYNKYSLCGCENRLLSDMLTEQNMEKNDYKKVPCNSKGHYCGEKEFMASSNLLSIVVSVLTSTDYRFLDECGMDVVEIIGSINPKMKTAVISSEVYVKSLYIYHHLPTSELEKISKLRWICYDFIYPKCELPVWFSENDQPMEFLDLLTPDENSNYTKIENLLETSCSRELTSNEAKMLKALIWQNYRIYEAHKTTFPQYFKLSKLNPDTFQFLFLSFQLQSEEVTFLNILKNIDASAASFKVLYSCISNMDTFYAHFKTVLYSQLQSLSKISNVTQDVTHELCCLLNELFSKQPKLLKELGPFIKPFLINNPNEMTYRLLKRTQQ